MNQAVEKDVQAALEDTGYHEMRRVTCDFNGSTLTLRGRVPSYYMMQVAVTTASAVDGIESVDNQLEVRYSVDQ